MSPKFSPSSLFHNKSGVSLLVLALVTGGIGGIGAQAHTRLNTEDGGYLICITPKSNVVIHPTIANCPKGYKRIVLGHRGQAGAPGLRGARGLNGAIGLNGAPGIDGTTGQTGPQGTPGIRGSDGKTLWNGVKDPESTWGAAGDMFINATTKVLFGPKELTTGWPAGVPMLGLTGAKGDIGATGIQGPGGPSGASGASGATGATGSTGSTGAQGANGSNGFVP